MGPRHINEIALGSRLRQNLVAAPRHLCNLLGVNSRSRTGCNEPYLEVVQQNLSTLSEAHSLKVGGTHASLSFDHWSRIRKTAS